VSWLVFENITISALNDAQVLEKVTLIVAYLVNKFKAFNGTKKIHYPVHMGPSQVPILSQM
jgi:hypothetical protein